MIENSLYYTFSTIAQVLAAFIALSGVFVLRKLDLVNKIQTNYVKSFLDEWYYLNGNFKLGFDISLSIKRLKDFSTTSDDYISLLFQLKNTLNQIDPKSDKLEEGKIQLALNHVILVKSQLIEFQLYKLALTYLTKFSLILGFVTIVLSILLLSVIHKDFIQNHSTLLFSVCIACATISLILMVFVIIFSLVEYSQQNRFYKIIVKYLLSKNKNKKYIIN